MKLRDLLAKRWHESYDALPVAKPAKIAIERSLTALEAVQAKHDALAKDANLTPLGRRNQLQRFIAAEVVGDLRFGRKAAEKLQAQIAKRKVDMQPAKPDKADIAAAVLRSEYRTMLRAMSAGQRAAFCSESDLDSTIVQAILEVPANIVQLPDVVRRLIVDRETERAHPGLAEMLDTASEISNLVSEAADGAWHVARAAAEFPELGPTFQSFVDGSTGNVAAEIDRRVESAFSDFAAVA